MSMSLSVKKIETSGLLAFLITGLLALSTQWGGSGGCGGAASRGAEGASGLSLTTTVTLPGSLASAGLIVDGIKSATTEVAQAGDTCVFYSGDTELGRCKTGSDGTCTATPTSTVSTGDNNIFVKVLDKGGNEVAGSMLNTTVASDTTTIATTVNSTEDLSYQTWKGACAKALGTDCAPGTNVSEGIKKVVPSCIHDAFKEMAKPDTTKTGQTDTTDVYVSALLEAHKTNIGSGIGSGTKPPIDVASMMKGDATSRQSMINTVGSTIPSAALSALTLKDVAAATVSTATAIDTALSALDAVVKSMCNDPTTYATIKADKTYAADPGAAFKVFKMMKPSEFTGFDNDAMKNMMANAIGVGDGFKTWSDPLAARASMDTLIAGGIPKGLSAAETQKRMGAIFGAGVPKDFDEAKSRGRAAFNMYGSSNWSGGSADDAFKRFGPLLSKPSFQSDCIAGGKTAFDNYISAQGGLAGFEKAFDKLGSGSTAADAFMTAYDQQDIGGTCTRTDQCVPPYSCGASGKCALGTFTAAFTGGPGTACTANTDCSSSNGFVCDSFIHSCIFGAGQASGGTFAVGGLDPTQVVTTGAGAGCTQNSQCSTGTYCQNGGCFAAPTGGFTGGSPNGLSCSGNSNCQSNNCAGNKCVAPGGDPNGIPCTSGTQCASTFCASGLCSATATFTAKANGATCTGAAECYSGYCGGGVCNVPPTTISLKANGATCSSNAECTSVNCVGGLCQAVGTTTRPNGSFCTSNLECTSMFCVTGLCSASATTGLPPGSTCTSTSQCGSGLTCRTATPPATGMFCAF